MVLDYLDREIEYFKQKNNNYPAKIIMNKETKDKLFAEIEKENFITNSWKDRQDNYRGILIETSQEEQIKLE